MPSREEIRTQIEQCAREFYGQALNLTMANPLLRLPTGTRGVRCVAFPDYEAEAVATLLAESSRKLGLIGHDAPPALLEVAKQSRQPYARRPMRLVLATKHDTLEATMRSIARKHDELLEKRGLPCAYIYFGTLRWTSDDQKETRSPLLLVPVEIDNDRDTELLKTVTFLAASERDPIENPALREYLRSKFGVELPRLGHEFDPTWENIRQWLDTKVTRLLKARPGWVVEHSVGFGLFDCGAIAADCALEHWAAAPTESDVLRRVLCSTDIEHQTEIEPGFMVPSLVLDADGSQLGALQTVARGSSIVLHGPPGSGKSQTIVNLVAQAMSCGKSVLFVAQKPEAAHVVHRRLAECGLDPFCTMLVPTGESRNTKSAVLDSLRKREALKPNARANQAADQERLLQHVDMLNRYAGALGVSVPEVQMTAQQAVAELAVFSMNGIHAASLEHVIMPGAHEQLVRAEQALGRLDRERGAIDAEAFKVLGGMRLRRTTMDGAEAGFAFHREMDRLGTSCEELQRCMSELRDAGCPPFGESLSDIEEFVAALPSLEPLAGVEWVARAARLCAPHAPRALAQAVSIRVKLAELQSRIPRARDVLSSGAVPRAQDWQRAVLCAERFEVGGLARSAGEELVNAVNVIRSHLETAAAAAGEGEVFRLAAQPLSTERWLAVAALLDKAAEPGGARRFLVQELASAPQSAEAIREVAAAARTIHDLQAALSQTCVLERLPSTTELRICHSAVAARRSVISRLVGWVTDTRYRSACKQAREILLPHVSRGHWAAELAKCVELAHARDTMQRVAGQAGLKPGHSMDPAHWQEADAWMAEVSARANAAQVPLASVFALVQTLERGELRRGEEELVRAASALARRPDLAAGLSRTVEGGVCTLKSLVSALESLGWSLRQFNRLADSIGVARTETLGRVARVGTLFCQLHDESVAFRESVAARALFAEDFKAEETDPTAYQHIMGWLDSWRERSTRPRLEVRAWLFEGEATAAERAGVLARAVQSMAQHATIASTCVSHLTSEFAFGGAAISLEPGRARPMQQMLAAVRVVRQHCGHIQAVFVYGEHSQACAHLAGAPLMERYASGEIPQGALVPTYRRTIIEALLRRDPRLAPLVAADRVALEDAVRELPRLEKNIREFNAKRLIADLAKRQPPPGVSEGRVRDYTEYGLIRHLTGLTRPRFEVQDLFARARNAMRTLQPCIIATPDAVSEYLPRLPGAFDLLIMDEASQVPPAAAFGSLARAQQAVIVGDPKQLPPTSFFLGGGGLAEESDEEDMRGVTDVESILERAISSLKNVHLRGHYRSKHHSLIAFSNRRFYERRLVVAPNVQPRNAKYGVSAQFVDGARYSSGINEAEADRVAQAAMEHLSADTGESLGIVAFNARQAELIETKLEAIAGRSRDRYALYAKAKEGDMPLFVRNLESVQGDERDVIFISYTYGRDAENDQVYQRFGPILNQGGERRLNVLVTRAKHRVVVFHSMHPTEIKSEAVGAQVMREYLQYALQAPESDFAGGDFESDFEAQVARAIEAVSSDLVVTPQVRCDGFRIDLGVSRKADPARFILGVECDGATYHGSASARDRDLVRQTILEHRGWKLHRIWSTAWWKNAAQERERLAVAVRDAMRAAEVASR